MKFRSIKSKFTRTKTFSVLKKVTSLVLTLAVIAGAIIGLSALVKQVKRTDKTVVSIYEIGGLTNTGEYVETKKSIYTKNMFDASGLTITPTFESDMTYRVFLYDENGKYTSTLNGGSEKLENVFGRYARIEITPSGNNDVKFYEVLKIARQLKITVDKEQNWDNNLYVVDKNMNGKEFTTSMSATTTKANNICSKVIENHGYETLTIKVLKTDSVLAGTRVITSDGTTVTKTALNAVSGVTVETDGNTYIVSVTIDSGVTDIAIDSTATHVIYASAK